MSPAVYLLLTRRGAYLILSSWYDTSCQSQASDGGWQVASVNLMCIWGQYHSPASKRCRQGTFPARTYFDGYSTERVCNVYVSVLIWLCQERILHVLLCFFMAVLSMWPIFNKSFINHATALGIWRISYTCKTSVKRQLENITFDWLLLSALNKIVQSKFTTLLDLSLCTFD